MTQFVDELRRRRGLLTDATVLEGMQTVWRSVRHLEMECVENSAALRGLLRVLQHPGPQFWGPAIGGNGKQVTGL